MLSDLINVTSTTTDTCSDLKKAVAAVPAFMLTTGVRECGSPETELCNPFKYKSSLHRLACAGLKERGKKERKSTQGKAFCLQQAKNYVSDRENTCTVQSSRESTQSASDLMKGFTLHSFWQYVPKSGASQNKNSKKTSFLCRSTHIYWVLLTDMQKQFT